MNNTIIFFFLLFSSTLCYGQTEVITLTEDLVLTESMVISNDVRIEGNGYSIVCESCHPVIQVTNGGTLHLEEVLFPRSFRTWLRVKAGGSASWRSKRMRGHLTTSE